MLLPVLSATEGGSQLAGETYNRTLQLILVRPVSRSRMFLTKLLPSAVCPTALVGLLLAVALAVGLLAVGWGDLNVYPGILQMTARHQHLDQRDALVGFLLPWPIASIALSTPLAISFFMSIWMRNPMNTIAASVAVFLVL